MVASESLAAEVDVIPHAPSRGEHLLPPMTQCYKNGFVVGGLEANAKVLVCKETEEKLVDQGKGKLLEATERKDSRSRQQGG